MGFFQGDDHKYVVNWNFGKFFFQMRDDNKCELNHLKKFHFKCFLVD
jgi:hypothetical protein